MSRTIIPMPEITFNTKNSNIIVNDDNYNIDSNDNFLKDLEVNTFVSKDVIDKQNKEQKLRDKENDKNDIKMRRLQREEEKQIKLNNKKVVETKKDEDDELFEEQGSILYGRDKLQLIAKINQYKLLFPDIKALKALKLKKNPSIEELQIYLIECESLVETDTLEIFLTDSILSTLKMVEYASIRTKYNISGLSELLKKNPQFTQLSKQLYLKYKVFSKIPPEYQMLMLVSTSAWICLETNKKALNNNVSINNTIDPIFLTELNNPV